MVEDEGLKLGVRKCPSTSSNHSSSERNIHNKSDSQNEEKRPRVLENAFIPECKHVDLVAGRC